MIPTTHRRLLLDGDVLTERPGEQHHLRTELGGGAPDSCTTLVRLLHLTDLHVIDPASPARAEWVEALADDPRWRPLLHMHRPYDVLSNHAAVAFAAAAHGWSDDPIDAAIVTGDCIDNAQRNELDAYLAALDGGELTFATDGPLHPGWRDAIDARADPLWPFWSPEDDRPDLWKSAHRFPQLRGLLHAAASPHRSEGLPFPWYGVIGNHDVMRQGTAFTNTALESIATGAWKAYGAQSVATGNSPVERFVVAPEEFSTGASRFAVAPDAQRRAVTAAEFAAAHRRRGRGFDAGGRDAGPSVGDYAFDVHDEVRVVVLDTNHPGGNYNGSVGTAQLEWLDAQLAAATGRTVVLASHHGAPALTNTTGVARLGASELTAVVHRHGNVAAWLVGHRHVHRVAAVPDPAGRSAGFWEITTGSLIDWPCQARVVELLRERDGRVHVRTTVVDHDAPIDWRDAATDRDGWHAADTARLASLHRELAARFHRAQLPRPDTGDAAASLRHARSDGGRCGAPADRNALLLR